MALRVGYVVLGYHVLSVDPNTVRADLSSPECTSGARVRGGTVLKTRNIFRRADSAESLSLAGFFWLTEGNSQLQPCRWK